MFIFFLVIQMFIFLTVVCFLFCISVLEDTLGEAFLAWKEA